MRPNPRERPEHRLALDVGHRPARAAVAPEPERVMHRGLACMVVPVQVLTVARVAVRNMSRAEVSRHIVASKAGRASEGPACSGFRCLEPRRCRALHRVLVVTATTTSAVPIRTCGSQ